MIYRYIKLVNGYPCGQTLPQKSAIKNYKEQFGEDCYELVLGDNDYLRERYVIEQNKLKIATEFDAYNYDRENYKLKDDYYFKRNGGIIVDILKKPEHDLIQPHWSDEIEQWVEMANETEISNHEVFKLRHRIEEEERELRIQTKVNLVKGVSNKAVEDRKAVLKEYNKQVDKFAIISANMLEGNNLLPQAYTYTTTDYNEAKKYIEDLLDGKNPTQPKSIKEFGTKVTNIVRGA